MQWWTQSAQTQVNAQQPDIQILKKKTGNNLDKNISKSRMYGTPHMFHLHPVVDTAAQTQANAQQQQLDTVQ
jgi:hypothetical protein